MIIFELFDDSGSDREIIYLGNTLVTGEDDLERDCIYEQLDAHTAHLDE